MRLHWECGDCIGVCWSKNEVRAVERWLVVFFVSNGVGRHVVVLSVKLFFLFFLDITTFSLYIRIVYKQKKIQNL